MSTIETTLPTGTWNVDPVHSQVGFEVAYMVGAFRGTFSPFEAVLDVPAEGEATLRGATRVEGVRVQDENLTAHLQSPDFFDAERSPEITFRSSSISVDGDAVTIEGEIAIKGTSQPLTLTGSITGVGQDAYGNDRIGLDVEGTVDRSAFGLNWNAPLPNGEPALANDVTLTADLSFVKAA
jgi:polyisoprenoid-binding protein YceI